MPRIQQLVDADLEDPRDLAVRRRQCGRRGCDRDDRMQPESADRDVERRQRAEHPHAGRAPAPLLRAPRATPPARRFRPDRRRRPGSDTWPPCRSASARTVRTMCAVTIRMTAENADREIFRVLAVSAVSSVVGKHQQEAGGVADARRVEAGRPLAARHRRQPVLRGRSRQRAARRSSRERVGEGHGWLGSDDRRTARVTARSSSARSCFAARDTSWR